MNSGPSPLDHHLGYWLRLVSNRVSGAFRERVEARGATVAEWVALRSLHSLEPASLGDLARETGADAGATSRLIDRLVRRDLVSRAAAPGDRRGVALTLTAAGRALVTQLAREADRNDALFFAALPERDRDHLRRILKGLAQSHRLTEKPTE